MPVLYLKYQYKIQIICRVDCQNRVNVGVFSTIASKFNAKMLNTTEVHTTMGLNSANTDGNRKRIICFHPNLFQESKLADQQLQVFATVARLLSFTQTAGTLHMTQPTVTFQK